MSKAFKLSCGSERRNAVSLDYFAKLFDLPRNCERRKFYSENTSTYRLFKFQIYSNTPAGRGRKTLLSKERQYVSQNRNIAEKENKRRYEKNATECLRGSAPGVGHE